MEALPLIIGLGISAFLVLYFVFLWDKKEHIFLRILGSFFFVILLFLIPKAALDYDDHCEVVVNLTKSTYHNNSVLLYKNETYTHDYVCVEQERSTSSIFYKTILWFQRIFFAYILVYFIYRMFLVEITAKFMARFGKK